MAEAMAKRARTAVPKLDIDISGMFPPIPTHFHGNGLSDKGVDWDAMRANINRYAGVKGLTGLIVQGSNGEYVMLSEDERVEVVRFAKETLKGAGRGSMLVVAGCGMEGTAQTIGLAKKMVAAGADALLVITPCYFKASMNERALEAHFDAVAEALPDTPIILYNMPANTGIDMSHALIAKVSKKHRNIVGLKDSGGNVQKLAMVRQAAPELQVLAGSFGFLLPALAIGCVGGICAMANACPEDCCKVMELWKANDLAAAQELQNRLTETNFAVTAKYGVPAMKTLMLWRGFAGKPHVRLPLLPLTSEEESQLLAIFQRGGIELPGKPA
mmetsp:Transcript_23903/g.60847  ORF Transcript_23903/g.60847 Transcript_23903/m.60847 type:complete len:329 (-) Transcript_23903:87-1073(-)